MGAIATLSRADLVVVPGQEISVQVTVRNTGTVVDEFSVVPLGDVSAWIVAEPAALPLYPGAEGVFTVRIATPRASAVAPGPVNFALRVVSAEDPSGSVVEEGVLQVARFGETSAELLPRTSRARGRRAGRHELAIDNRGNESTDVVITPVDVDGKLEIICSATSMLVRPGEAAFLTLRVRGRKGFLRGPGVTHPFQVFAEPGNDAPIALEGSFLQEAAVPKWVPKLLAALLALAVLLAVLWLTVLKPVIKDQAKDAANTEAKKVAGQAASTAAQKAVAPVAAAQGQQGAAIATVLKKLGLPQPPPVPTLPAGVVDPLGTPNAIRLTAALPSFTVAAKQVFSLTDIVFQNPNGDSGTVQLTRGSQMLFQERLDNFRDLDQHFVAPIVSVAGQLLTIKVACDKPGQAATSCTPAVLLSGFARAAP